MAEDSTASSLPPLCVDLDDTLLKTDLLYETLLSAVKGNPLSVLLIPFWLVRGRAYLKQRLAFAANIDINTLPYRSDLLQFLRAEQQRGRRLVLVSAAHRTIAEGVQDHLGLFNEVIASDGTSNVKGWRKAQILEERFGRQQFDYAGDAHADFAVWRSARRALVVSNRRRFIRAINSIVPVDMVFPKSSGRFALLVNALRLRQWAKNLLVFVPILTGHKFFDQAILTKGALAFVSFSLISSGVYLLNDLLDLESDRAHVTKRHRAIAAGELSIFHASALCLLLLLAGVGLGWFCGATFLLFVAIYVLSNLAYSMWLKRVVMLDVVVLACFYALRLLAGGAATEIGCSDWLLAFSVFFFFCLAMVKRYSELRGLIGATGTSAPGRGYFPSDLEAIGTFGVGSGLISVLVLVLYVMSPEVRLLYAQPRLLLLLCPLFLYWITRLWFKAHRGEVPEDPVVFAITDRTSYIAGLLAAAVLYAATV
jgi:4-hydroxybenzoate polyprenyltransferase